MLRRHLTTTGTGWRQGASPCATPDRAWQVARGARGGQRIGAL